MLGGKERRRNRQRHVNAKCRVCRGDGGSQVSRQRYREDEAGQWLTQGRKGRGCRLKSSSFFLYGLGDFERL